MSDSLPDQANILVHQKKFREALKLYTEIIKQFPNSSAGYQGAALSYRGLRAYEQALPYAIRAVEMDPNSSAANINLAYIYLNRNEVEKSIAAANRALGLAPESSEALECLATILMRQKRYEPAIQSYKKALERDPDSIIAHTNLANIYDRLGQTAELVRQLKALFAIRPSFKNGYFLLLAYTRHYFVISAILILAITGVAYYINIPILLLIPFLFVAQLIWRIILMIHKSN